MHVKRPLHHVPKNAQFDSCQANMVTSPFIGSFKNVPQTNSEQLVLDDMVHYAGRITPHHWKTWSP